MTGNTLDKELGADMITTEQEYKKNLITASKTTLSYGNNIDR